MREEKAVIHSVIVMCLVTSFAREILAFLLGSCAQSLPLGKICNIIPVTKLWS